MDDASMCSESTWQGGVLFILMKPLFLGVVRFRRWLRRGLRDRRFIVKHIAETALQHAPDVRFMGKHIQDHGY